MSKWIPLLTVVLWLGQASAAHGSAASVPTATSAGSSATASAAADPGLEAYRRLPYCRLAPDGLHLAVEPCRRPPTRTVAPRRSQLQPLPAPASVKGQRALPAAVSLPVPPPPAYAVPSAPAAPSLQPLNPCDASGCRSSNGTPYAPGAGNILFDPSGRMCTRHGQWVQCN